MKVLNLTFQFVLKQMENDASSYDVSIYVTYFRKLTSRKICVQHSNTLIYIPTSLSLFLVLLRVTDETS